MDGDRLKAQLRSAFARTPFPSSTRLRNASEECEEACALEEAFEGKSDWTALDAAFLDDAPDGWGTASCFFSPEAFRFYLPAYLIADVDGLLHRVTPAFHLTNGFAVLDSARRIGAASWETRMREYASRRFAVFTPSEAAAIVAYLSWVRERDDFFTRDVERALAQYWVARAQA